MEPLNIIIVLFVAFSAVNLVAMKSTNGHVKKSIVECARNCYVHPEANYFFYDNDDERRDVCTCKDNNDEVIFKVQNIANVTWWKDMAYCRKKCFQAAGSSIVTNFHYGRKSGKCSCISVDEYRNQTVFINSFVADLRRTDRNNGCFRKCQAENLNQNFAWSLTKEGKCSCSKAIAVN